LCAGPGKRRMLSAPKDHIDIRINHDVLEWIEQAIDEHDPNLFTLATEALWIGMPNLSSFAARNRNRLVRVRQTNLAMYASFREPYAASRSRTSTQPPLRTTERTTRKRIRSLHDTGEVGPAMVLGAGAAAGFVGVLLMRGLDATLTRGSTVEMILDRPLVFRAEDLDLSKAPPQAALTEGAPPATQKKSGWSPTIPF
jgi:hypothetical protein